MRVWHLENFMTDKNITGLSSLSDEIETELNNYINLYIILYADDTVLLSESKTDLQNQLDALYEYCNLWKLKVNIDKSKIMVFSKGRLPNNLEFKYDGKILEIVNEFTYLGILFSRSGSFIKEKKV